MTDFPLDHLSASSINKFLRCPQQWQDSYLLKRKARVGSALVIGSYVHSSLSNLMQGKQYDAKALFAEAVEKEDGLIDWKEKPEDAYRIGTKMVLDYWEAVGRHLTTVKTEQEFDITLEGVGIPVVGFVDLETRNTVIDYKSTAYFNTKSVRVNKEWIFQIAVYQLIVPKPGEVHVITRAKVAQPIVVPTSQSHPLHFGLIDRDKTAKIIRDCWLRMMFYWETYGLEKPWPGNPTHDWASRYCGVEDCCKL